MKPGGHDKCAIMMVDQILIACMCTLTLWDFLCIQRFINAVTWLASSPVSPIFSTHAKKEGDTRALKRLGRLGTRLPTGNGESQNRCFRLRLGWSLRVLQGVFPTVWFVKLFVVLFPRYCHLQLPCYYSTAHDIITW